MSHHNTVSSLRTSSVVISVFPNCVALHRLNTFRSKVFDLYLILLHMFLGLSSSCSLDTVTHWGFLLAPLRPLSFPFLPRHCFYVNTKHCSGYLYVPGHAHLTSHTCASALHTLMELQEVLKWILLDFVSCILRIHLTNNKLIRTKRISNRKTWEYIVQMWTREFIVQGKCFVHQTTKLQKSQK